MVGRCSFMIIGCDNARKISRTEEHINILGQPQNEKIKK